MADPRYRAEAIVNGAPGTGAEYTTEFPCPSMEDALARDGILRGWVECIRNLDGDPVELVVRRID